MVAHDGTVSSSMSQKPLGTSSPYTFLELPELFAFPMDTPCFPLQLFPHVSRVAGDAGHELSQGEHSETPRHFLLIKTPKGFEARELNRMEDILAVEEHRESIEFLAPVHGKIKTTFRQEKDATLNLPKA